MSQENSSSQVKYYAEAECGEHLRIVFKEVHEREGFKNFELAGWVLSDTKQQALDVLRLDLKTRLAMIEDELKRARIKLKMAEVYQLQESNE